VRDLAAACLAVLSSDKAVGAIYNVAGQAFTLEAYLDTASRILGVNPRIERVPHCATEDLPPYGFGSGSLVLDTQRIEDQVGFFPAIDLNEGLRTAITGEPCHGL